MPISPHNFVHDSISFVLACVPAIGLFAIFAGNAIQERRRNRLTAPHAQRQMVRSVSSKRTYAQERKAA